MLEADLAALLILGHVLADFTLQTKRMVAGKHRLRPWSAHVTVVFAAHAAPFLPVLTGRGFAVLAGLTVTHGLIDRAKTAVQARTDRRLWPFVADQSVHFASLALGWVVLGDLLRPWPSWWPENMAFPVLVAAAYIFNGVGGSALVRDLLHDHGPDRDGDDQPGGGFLVGMLERWLVLTLVLVDQWAAVGLVVAAKSLVRMDRFHEDKAFAEYYLLGTFSSLLVAVASGLLVRFVV